MFWSTCHSCLMKWKFLKISWSLLMEVIIFSIQEKFRCLINFLPSKNKMKKILALIRKRKKLLLIQNSHLTTKKNIWNNIFASFWSIAKWQGNRFWYDHSKVRILLLQYDYNFFVLFWKYFNIHIFYSCHTKKGQTTHNTTTPENNRT